MAVKFGVAQWIRILLVLSVTLLGVAIIGFFTLPWWLIPSLPTEAAHLPEADVIIHWPTTPRSQSDDWVVELYQKGKAKKIVCVSWPISWDLYAADSSRQHLIALGVPAEDVLTLHLEQEACAAPNIRRVAAHVKSQGWQRALVVTGPITEGRRLEKYFQQQGLQLALTYAQKDRDELTTGWWKTHWKIQVMIEAAIGSVLDSAYAECW